MLIPDSEEKLQNILTTVTIESEKKGLQLNAWSSQNNQTFLYVIFFAKGERIKQVDTFKYLGFTITPDPRCKTEIKKRIALSKDTFAKMKSISTNRNIRIYTKFNTLKAYTWSIPLHGCEYWELTKDLERGLEAAEMWFIRRIMRKSWTEKKSN